MKVKYLIELLQKENPNIEVYLHEFSPERGGEDIMFVTSLANGNGGVRISGRYDVDLKDEIKEIYKHYREHYQGKFKDNRAMDFCHKHLKNHSITVDDVEEVMGIDSACEYKKYLEENKNDKA